MKGNKVLVMFALFLILCWPVTSMAASDTLIIIATKAAQTSSDSWISFLKVKDISLKTVEPADFEKVKKEKYITILGGMDEAGIKDIAKQALSADEFQWAGQKGNGKMYLKSAVWTAGQQVMLFVGSDLKVAEEARKTTRDDWMDKYTKWFELEEGGQKLPAY